MKISSSQRQRVGVLSCLFVALCTLASALMKLWVMQQRDQNEWLEYFLVVLLFWATYGFAKMGSEMTASLFDEGDQTAVNAVAE